MHEFLKDESDDHSNIQVDPLKFWKNSFSPSFICLFSPPLKQHLIQTLCRGICAKDDKIWRWYQRPYLEKSHGFFFFFFTIRNRHLIMQCEVARATVEVCSKDVIHYGFLLNNANKKRQYHSITKKNLIMNLQTQNILFISEFFDLALWTGLETENVG